MRFKHLESYMEGVLFPIHLKIHYITNTFQKILQQMLQGFQSVSDDFGTLYIKGLNFIFLFSWKEKLEASG